MKNIKINLFFIILVFSWANISSKELTIESFEKLGEKDLTAQLNPRLDQRDSICALVKVVLPEGAKFEGNIISSEFDTNEYLVYFSPGTKRFQIKLLGYETLSVETNNFNLPTGLESARTYRLKLSGYDELSPLTKLTTLQSQNDKNLEVKSFSKDIGSDKIYPSFEKTDEDRINDKIINYLKINSLYFQAGYNILGLSGMNIGVGGYIKNFNMEANYLIGFSKSGDIYWNDSSGDTMPIVANYSPMGFDFNVGYGILIGNRFRLTPQIGIQYVALSESADKKVANNANAMSLPIGAKAEFAIVRHFAISLEPSYIINVTKSEGYKALSEISSKIKGYSDGFGINVSLNVNF